MRNDVPMRIGLFNAMGYGNLGDAAIQDAIIANIRSRLPQVQLFAFSYVPVDTVERHGIPCFPITRSVQGQAPTLSRDDGRGSLKSTLNSGFKRVPGLTLVAKVGAVMVREGLFLARTYRTLLRVDILVFSGGGQLCELWGGPWAHLFNLFKFSVLARLAVTRLYFLDVGAERLEHRLSRFFAKSAVQLAHYVSFRDLESETVVQGLGVKVKTCVQADPVYALAVANYLNGSPAGNSRPIVGINPMGFCDPRIWPRKEPALYDAYLEKLTRLSLWLLERGYGLKLFPTSPGVDKYAIADLKRRIVERFGSRASTGKDFAPPGPNVEDVLCESVKEVLGEISKCDFIVTSKYHGVIFSHLLNKPVIALSYQRKIDVAMQAVGLGDYCASIEHFEADWLMDEFRSLIRCSETIKAQEAEAVTACADRLRRQFDALFSGGKP